MRTIADPQTVHRRTQAPPAPPCTLVVFGVTGDLAHRLLTPALYNLSRWNLLPDDFALIGVGRNEEGTTQALRDDLTAAARAHAAQKDDGFDEGAWQRLAGAVSYLVGDLEDDATYARLAERIEQGRGGRGAHGGVLFYLAVGAGLFGPVIRRLAAAGLAREEGDAWRRVIVEKPFGHDLASARALNRTILEVLDEAQVYRIDHFLGKETVQNIMAFRFGNGFFEPIWNRDHIDHVQITVAETVGVEKRGRFYEPTGALRDMVPNHLFQLLALTAMEPPTSFAADAVRGRKQDALAAVRPLSGEDVAENAVRAQYRAGMAGGRALPAYRGEPGVAPDSSTETYVAMRLTIDNWRWAGVPFFLRTGKALARRDTEIAIRFKQAPLALFRGTGVQHCQPNWLVLQIQPDEGISLQFGAKVPGPNIELAPVEMRFSYADYFNVKASTGYETLIYDAMIGDATLYQRADTIEAGWEVVQPILDAFAAEAVPLATYPAGSAGPAEADALLADQGCGWRPLA
ncbi:glucose-6-phosphate dehydrogenase [Salinarimonas soli]|uniref:Glucose-6-phosphate 1-dehydrogenase n=1 Tax=Salinarimonas soli TaxID=1638099 RepID=A0A5B2VB90_9HYPH|nr:glucose-6-phosphate dehydrogenase [Salinarimonas soli]KAA2235437.1 glucose-6-phosphate dehydrogenase [Salinarimonas soli]